MARPKHTVSAEELLADIRGKCLDCCCGSRKLVDECRDKECRLWKHRRGLAGQQEAMFAPDDLPGQMDIYDIFKQEVFG